MTYAADQVLTCCSTVRGRKPVFVRIVRFVSVSVCAAVLAFPSVHGDEKFRTDDGDDDSLPWFQLIDGRFPPDGSAHYFPGELIESDHLRRSFVVRNDRSDSQNRSHWDLPVYADMLPFGSIWYHGAPAALRDIPIGTHLHGWYYVRDPNDKTPLPDGWNNRKSYEAEFTRCLRLEDDFSYHKRHGRYWKIESVVPDDGKLTAVLMQNDQPVGKPQTFDLTDATRIWQADRVADVTDLAAGQKVQFNITWATLYGPGRILELWADEQSRALASQQQAARHRMYVRERGLAGRVDKVDNQKRIVTITLFGGVDPVLYQDLAEGDQAGIAVADKSLRTYDPVNDRKRGPILDVRKIAVQPGSSGIQIDVQPDLLLEGYRPNRIVRVYPSGWPVIALPKEEQLFGRE